MIDALHGSVEPFLAGGAFRQKSPFFLLLFWRLSRFFIGSEAKKK
jgi:hypothetical protein